MDYNHAFVCLMGMGTVFFGLICLIVLTSVMSAVLCAVGKQPTACATPAPQPAAPATGAVTPADCRRIHRHGGGPGHRHHRHPHRIRQAALTAERENCFRRFP